MVEFAEDELVWLQLYRELRRRIEDGRYRERMPIPSLRQLDQEFPVSRGTIVKVVTLLAEEGFVRPIRGRGTYVRPRAEWPQSRG
ncbi:GntR family transcriptional regulator [Spongiactinospora sp. TRM90649]|uniref:GntR family transcriptional regulator n=1 Tax=Spongiactinospora sp. TRM90649 TaxID=3031114 RepID=UPI0023F9F404|nr:GntR family transcriptional regulator [Spongiactinospora sp. TRM90649]MDF5758781.1 GntR family transcriptional regulator [Spongiactinospora sp. TRM90649]